MSMTNLKERFCKSPAILFFLIVAGCSDDRREFIPVTTVTTITTDSTSLNFSESVTSGTVEFAVTASSAIGADVDTKTTEGENDFSTTRILITSIF